MLNLTQPNQINNSFSSTDDNDKINNKTNLINKDKQYKDNNDNSLNNKNVLNNTYNFTYPITKIIQYDKDLDRAVLVTFLDYDNSTYQVLDDSLTIGEVKHLMEVN